MFCIASFIILAILGIFSATFRPLVKEALDCVLRRVTLRPCTTGFDEKIKARILGSVITRSESAARLLNRNFELLSWIFFLLMVGSTLWFARGMYFFYTTGSCSSTDSSSFCIFDPAGKTRQMSALTEACPDTPPSVTDLTLQGVDLRGFPVLNPGQSDSIVFIGCYGCDYSREVYPLVKELALKRGARLTFVDYPVKVATDLMARLGDCVYRQDRRKYWALNDMLFAAGKPTLDQLPFAREVVAQLGLDGAEIDRCLNDPQERRKVRQGLDEIAKTNFYGTPTVFVNGRPLVGPKPYRVYAIALDGLFYWMK